MEGFMMSKNSVKGLSVIAALTILLILSAKLSAEEDYENYMEALQILKMDKEIKAFEFTLPAVNLQPAAVADNKAQEEQQDVKTTIDETGQTKITGSFDKIMKWAEKRWGGKNADDAGELPNISLKDYRGSVVFLNFWATWCPACREEMPQMEKLYQTLKGTNFEILAISIDRTGSHAVVPFMKELGLSFPALLDPDRKVSRKYSVISVPTSYLLDCRGYIVGKAIGAREWDGEETVQLIKSMQKGPQCKI
jgi:peroxiredoxin